MKGIMKKRTINDFILKPGTIFESKTRGLAWIILSNDDYNLCTCYIIKNKSKENISSNVIKNCTISSINKDIDLNILNILVQE